MGLPYDEALESPPVSLTKQPRFRFSIKAIIAAMTVLAVGLGGWIAYSNYRLQGLFELRQQGAIVVVRDRTPQGLRALGFGQLSPFFDVPTVELYVTPAGDNAFVGNTETLTSRGNARSKILEQVATARSYGAEDIHLVVVDDFDQEWMAFAQENSLTAIGDSKQRYIKRVRANQESGANINP